MYYSRLFNLTQEIRLAFSNAYNFEKHSSICRMRSVDNFMTIKSERPW